MTKLALILGSGFSAASGLPTTWQLSERFCDRTDGVLNQAINTILKTFWSDVFGYRDHGQRPSLEDHFTRIDQAANTGHHLGVKYAPKQLRAIRRMSIHRIFDILNTSGPMHTTSSDFLIRLMSGFEVTVITSNWDVLIENRFHNDREIRYGIDVDWLEGEGNSSNRHLTLLKLHGSSNWLYCDCCKQIAAGFNGKEAFIRFAYLEASDFGLFDLDNSLWNKAKACVEDTAESRTCSRCGNKLAGRLATFSYQKFFALPQFQTVWSRAQLALQEADVWLFVGYSLPHADFELRHLLKSAQLARRNPSIVRCEVILKPSEGDREEVNRYKSFFGLPDTSIHVSGLKPWINHRMDSFCASHGATA